MKRILLLLFTLVTISFSSYAQKKYHASRIMKGVYNEYSKKWEYGNASDIDYELTIDDHSMAVNNKGNITTYFIGTQWFDKSNDQYGQIGWKALDGKQRECVIKMISDREKGNILIYVMYSDTSTIYLID